MGHCKVGFNLFPNFWGPSWKTQWLRIRIMQILVHLQVWRLMVTLGWGFSVPFPVGLAAESLYVGHFGLPHSMVAGSQRRSS